MSHGPCSWQAGQAVIREQSYPSCNYTCVCELNIMVQGLLLLNHRLAFTELTGNQFLLSFSFLLLT